LLEINKIIGLDWTKKIQSNTIIQESIFFGFLTLNVYWTSNFF
jgi:hypothetical protein